MKKYLGLLFLALFTFSCSSLPHFQPKKGNKMGYWEKVEGKKVTIHASLPSGTTNLNQYMYLLLRAGQICETSGKSFFKIEEPLKSSETNAKFYEVKAEMFCADKSSEYVFGPDDYRLLKDRFHANGTYLLRASETF